MKNYLIIGGSSGIGKSIVNKLSELGHAVYATYNKTPIQERDWIFYHQPLMALYIAREAYNFVHLNVSPRKHLLRILNYRF